jgi:hypothetical protein
VSTGETFAATTAGRLGAKGASASSYTVAATVAGSRTTFGASSLPISLTITTSSGPTNYFGASALNLAFTVATAGRRTTFATTASTYTVQTATAGTRTTFSTSTAPFLLSITSRGQIPGQAVAGPPTGGSLADVSSRDRSDARRPPRRSHGRRDRVTVVSFVNMTPPARFDAVPWTDAQVEEAATEDGTCSTIDTVALSPVDVDPAAPAARSFTTILGTGDDLWYRVRFLDASGWLLGAVAAVPEQPARVCLCALRDGGAARGAAEA